MNLDTEILNARIQQSKKEVQFYSDAVEMLVRKYNFHRLMVEYDLVDKWEDFPAEFVEPLKEGKIPSVETLRMIDTDYLDKFIQDALYLLGTIMGCMELENESEKSDDVKEFLGYINYIHMNESYMIQSLGFSALTLSTEQVPSGYFVERMFPVTEDERTNEISIDLICELHCGLVSKYLSLRDLHTTTITRTGITE